MKEAFCRPSRKRAPDALVGKTPSSSVNRSSIAFAVTKVLLFSLQPNLSKSFFNRPDQETAPEEKQSLRRKKKKRQPIYNMFARVRETKKEHKRNRKRMRKFPAQKRIFSPKKAAD